MTCLKRQPRDVLKEATPLQVFGGNIRPLRMLSSLADAVLLLCYSRYPDLLAILEFTVFIIAIFFINGAHISLVLVTCLKRQVRMQVSKQVRIRTYMQERIQITIQVRMRTPMWMFMWTQMQTFM